MKFKEPITLRSKVAEYLLIGFLRLIALIPKSWVSPLSVLFHFIAHPFIKKEYAKIGTNIQKIFDLPKNSAFSYMFQKQVIRHQIVSSIESLIAIYRPDHLKITGFEEFKSQIDKVREKSGSIIFVSGHLGNWELIGYFAALATGVEFVALGKPMRIEAITRVLDYTRKRLKMTILWNDGKDLFKKMLEVLGSGRDLGFVMDQKPNKRIGLDVNFFGRKTTYVAGPAAMAAKSGRPVLAIFGVRVGPWHYKVMCRELLAPGHGEKDENKITQMMASEIERVINIYPEQWTWNYKRWNFE
ncbi:MAG: lysophospholipid acyltransferase family protein [Oligoflexales bacterium]|nr:lysophospholipid acyltransferase family protein [Oligoflexales bacterium]